MPAANMFPCLVSSSVAFLSAATFAHGVPNLSERAAFNCSTTAIPYPSVFGAKITSLTAAVVDNHDNIKGLNFCNVTVTLTHPGSGDSVHNQVWLPLTGWNGRFQGVGGGGYAAGTWESMTPNVALGYACVSTDAGLNTMNSSGDASSFALVSEGNVNQYALLDFASRSVHDMTVIGKAVTQSFYGIPPNYSYWNGCSTGGRQGLMEAQMYPDDYDGIMAAAPAVNWNYFTPAQQWPNVVLNNQNYAPAQCEFDAVNKAAVASCDGLDGLLDGIIGAPGLCKFNPQSLVGKTYTCDADNSTHTFQAATATIVQKIWQGPVTPSGDFLWYGILPSTNFSNLANTTTYANGSTKPVSFEISDSWFRGFLFKDLTYDSANITYSEFPALFNQSRNEYDSVMGTMNPDLSVFASHGGKMISWQGLADQYIMPNGTMNYYDRVTAMLPNVTDFYRVFFAPGVGHCGGGIGPIPVDPLGAVVAWVENGTMPDVLLASSGVPINGSADFVVNGVKKSQNLCPFPMVSKWNGKGDPSVAGSFECVANF